MFNFKVNNTEVKTTSDYLDGLVLAYRDGLQGAPEALIAAFEPLLDKYHRLLMNGVWDPSDKDVTRFLSMLGKRDLANTATNISRSMWNLYEPEDVRQELIIVLLETALTYTNISSNFKFVLKERLTNDEDGLLRNAIITDRQVDDTALEDAYAFIEIGAIDRSWIKGLTASEGWDQLSALQRAIIKYIYHDGLAVSVAAKKLKISVRQIQRHNRKAKEILANHFQLEE